MNRDLSQIGYDTEELYFHQLNREKIEKMRAVQQWEKAMMNGKDPRPDIPVMEDEEYQEAA